MQELVPGIGNDATVLRFHSRGMVKRRQEARPGWFIAEWLEYLGLDQTVLVDGYGRSKGRISELVRGVQRWNEDDLAAFSRILGVSRGYLIEVNPLIHRKTAEGRAMLERGMISAPPPPVRKKA